MYLQLSAILGPAKATVGQTVETKLGSGVLQVYSIHVDTYRVNLGEYKRSRSLGKRDMLSATSCSLDLGYVELPRGMHIRWHLRRNPPRLGHDSTEAAFCFVICSSDWNT